MEDMMLMPPPPNKPTGTPFSSSQKAVKDVDEVLGSHGYIIRQPLTNNSLYGGSNKFVDSVKDWLESGQGSASEEFRDNLQNYLLDTDNFVDSLKPSGNPFDVRESAMLNLLMKVPCLQYTLLRVSLSKLDHFLTSPREDKDEILGGILKSLREVLPEFEDSLLDTMMMIIEKNKVVVGARVILSLGNIFPKHMHLRLAKFLIGLLHLCGDEVLKAISRLDLTEEQMRSVMGEVLCTVDKLECIPSILKFFFIRKHTIGWDVEQILQLLREFCNFKPIAGNDDLPKLATQRLALALSVSRTLRNTYREVFRRCAKEVKDSLTAFDIVALSLLYMEDPRVSKDLRLAFAKSEEFVRVLKQLLTDSPGVARIVLLPLINFLAGEVKSCKSQISSLRSFVLASFSSPGTKVASEFMHVLFPEMIQSELNRDLLLDILSDLVQTGLAQIVSSAMPEYARLVGNFSKCQKKRFFRIFAVVAEHADMGVDSLLTYYRTDRRLASCCYYATIERIKLTLSSNRDEDDKELRLWDYVNFLWTIMENDEQCCTEAIEELCNEELINLVPIATLEFIQQKLWETFKASFIAEVNAGEPISSVADPFGFGLVPAFRATFQPIHSESVLVLHRHRSVQFPPSSAPSLYKLLMTIEKRRMTPRSLALDAVLGYAALVPNLDTNSDDLGSVSSQVDSQLVDNLLVIINLFREMISLFGESEDFETRRRALIRLEQLTCLQSILLKRFGGLSASNATTSGNFPSLGKRIRWLNERAFDLLSLEIGVPECEKTLEELTDHDPNETLGLEPRLVISLASAIFLLSEFLHQVTSRRIAFGILENSPTSSKHFRRICIMMVRILQKYNDSKATSQTIIALHVCLDIITSYLRVESGGRKLVTKGALLLSVKWICASIPTELERHPSTLEDMCSVFCVFSNNLRGLASCLPLASSHVGLLMEILKLLPPTKAVLEMAEDTAGHYIRSKIAFSSDKVEDLIRLWLETSLHPEGVLAYMISSLASISSEYASPILPNCNSDNVGGYFMASAKGILRLAEKKDARDGLSIKNWTEIMALSNRLVQTLTERLKDHPLDVFVRKCSFQALRSLLRLFVKPGIAFLRARHRIFWEESSLLSTHVETLTASLLANCSEQEENKAAASKVKKLVEITRESFEGIHGRGQPTGNTGLNSPEPSPTDDELADDVLPPRADLEFDY